MSSVRTPCPKDDRKNQHGDKRKGLLSFHTNEQLWTIFKAHSESPWFFPQHLSHSQMPLLPHTRAHTQTPTDTVHPISFSVSASMTHTVQSRGPRSLKIWKPKLVLQSATSFPLSVRNSQRPDRHVLAQNQPQQ